MAEQPHVGQLVVDPRAAERTDNRDSPGARSSAARTASSVSDSSLSTGGAGSGRPRAPGQPARPRRSNRRHRPTGRSGGRAPPRDARRRRRRSRDRRRRTSPATRHRGSSGGRRRRRRGRARGRRRHRPSPRGEVAPAQAATDRAISSAPAARRSPGSPRTDSIPTGRAPTATAICMSVGASPT